MKRVIITVDDGAVDVKRWRAQLKGLPWVQGIRVMSAKEPDGDVKEVIDYMASTHLLRFGVNLYVKGAQDGAAVKKLLQTYGREELQGYWQKYLADSDPWIVDKGRSISLFASNIARYVTGGETARERVTCALCNGDGKWANERGVMGECPMCGGEGKV